VKKMICLVFVVAMSAGGHCIASDVPDVMAFHSVVYDGGGNLIQRDEADVRFKITDADGAVLFEEGQETTIANGELSLLIGNGTDADGKSSGGIPADIFATGGPLYLEATIDEDPPIGPMEIASVPYSMMAGVAHGVTKGAVDSKAIEDGSIAYADMSDEAVSGIVNAMTEGRKLVYKDELEDIYRPPSSAAMIGVERGLSYSGANDLQGVLGDMDLAIRRRDERISAEVSARAESMSVESENRQSADLMLDQAVKNEAATRSQSFQSEQQARKAADSNLSDEIDAVDGAKLAKSGGTISGSLSVAKNIAVGGTVDGISAGSHDHSGGTDGHLLYPGTIWVGSGIADHNDLVDVGTGFGSGSCKVMTAFARKTSGSPCTITAIDAHSKWEGDNFRIYCAITCSESGTVLCRASYMAICMKGM
jgi:hypothetical protein